MNKITNKPIEPIDKLIRRLGDKRMKIKNSFTWYSYHNVKLKKPL